MQFVVSGERRWAPRCALAGRLVRRSLVGIVSSRLVIDTMSNPRLYCSRASPKEQCSGPHWTKNSSTQVERLPCQTRLGSLRANICRMDALSPGGSVPRRGSMVVDRPRLEPACRRGGRAFPLAGKCKRMRVRLALLAVAWAAARCESDLSMESCLVSLSTSRGEGLSGREP